jgi:stalled ribosome rescue protein Dom34
MKYAIWLDSMHAKLFPITNGEGHEHKTLKAHGADHHTHQSNHNDVEQKEKKLFLEVAAEISSASQIVLMGPGDAKIHFQTFLNGHNAGLAKKIIACETVDHPTDPQLVAQAMKLFTVESSALHVH